MKDKTKSQNKGKGKERTGCQFVVLDETIIYTDVSRGNNRNEFPTTYE